MWKEGSLLLLVSPTEQNPLEFSMYIWSSSRIMFLRILLEAEWGQGGACLRGEPKGWVGSGLPHSDRATLPLTLSYADIYISPWRMSLEAKRSLRMTNKPNALIFQGIKKWCSVESPSLESELDENYNLCFLTLHSVSFVVNTLPPHQGPAPPPPLQTPWHFFSQATNVCSQEAASW